MPDLFNNRTPEAATLQHDAVSSVEPTSKPLAEPPCVLGKPDGYYLIGKNGGKEWCLVYLYNNEDFGGVRHIAFGPQDGSALMPVWDLQDDTELVPVTISANCTTPATLSDLRA